MKVNLEHFLVKGLNGNLLANYLLLFLFLAPLFFAWHFQTLGGPHATPVSSCLLPAQLYLNIYSCVLQEVNVSAKVCSLAELLAHMLGAGFDDPSCSRMIPLDAFGAEFSIILTQFSRLFLTCTSMSVSSTMYVRDFA